MKPPEVKDSWDDNDWWMKEKLLAYETVRQQDELNLASLGIAKHV